MSDFSLRVPVPHDSFPCHKINTTAKNSLDRNDDGTGGLAGSEREKANKNRITAADAVDGRVLCLSSGRPCIDSAQFDEKEVCSLYTVTTVVRHIVTS